MGTFKIRDRVIGQDSKTYFIADVAANHDGDLKRAVDLIYLCKEAGADAAKFQNFTASKIVSRTGFEKLGGKMSHQSKWKKSVYEVYEDASISQDWTPVLKETCDKAGIDYFTSPYDFDAIDHVNPFVECYKIGSGDITWPEIIDYMASKGKPIFLATGASDLADVTRAMEILLRRTKDVVLMQCNTNYTASLENFKYINLNVLKKFQTLYPDIVLGLSDHTPGHATVLGAVALGARVIEKHFTDDNNRSGPDHPFSMNPKTWRDMVDRTRELEFSLGDGIKRVEDNEKDSIVVQRRSLRATVDLNPGHVIQSRDLEPLRPIPPNGLPPYKLTDLVGKKVTKNVGKGDCVSWEHIES